MIEDQIMISITTASIIKCPVMKCPTEENLF